jgi:hypothetical protein
LSLDYLDRMTQTTQTSRPLVIRVLARIRRFLAKRLRNWRQRHQHPFNFAIHLIGIPLTVLGVFLLFTHPWYFGVGSFVVGYGLQFVGHAVEGNDAGEWIAVKKLLGLPGVATSPASGEPAPRS